MKLAHELNRDKLRGGFYTPPNLVTLCVNRAVSLMKVPGPWSVLEPSCGDGAFIRGIESTGLTSSIGHFTGVEIDGHEAILSEQELLEAGVAGNIWNQDAIDFLGSDDRMYDIAIGNPPFLRYQYISSTNGHAISRLTSQIGMPLSGVSNLWIPIFLGALSRLREGGSFSFVVPTEILTGVSAGVVRRWLLANVSDLVIDQFPAKSFPGVLQEVVVISGCRKMSGSPTITFVQNDSHRVSQIWSHALNPFEQNWTRYLLGSKANEAIDLFKASPLFDTLESFARLEVSIVTGANSFFTVSSAEVEEYGLEEFVLPLVPRIRYVEGIEFTTQDFDRVQQDSVKSWLLAIPEDYPIDFPDGVKKYLDFGTRLGVDSRYKTSIRESWYSVPSLWSGELLLSKRSHRYPRLVINSAKVMTTDTIYRGRMHPLFGHNAKGLVAGFHNSFTLLSAELEGRSFGGGVLELVPSEIRRLQVPHPEMFIDHFESLDRATRRWGEDCLIEQTDFLMLSSLHDEDLRRAWDNIIAAREHLLQRRLSRN